MSSDTPKPKKLKTEAFQIGFVLAAALQPFEVLRTRSVLHSESYKGFTGMGRLLFDIVKKEGVSHLWRGSHM